MPTYTFQPCNPYGVATSLDIRELTDDAAALAWASELLDEHLSCEYVEIWKEDRPVIARHRHQPSIRPIEDVPVKAQAS